MSDLCLLSHGILLNGRDLPRKSACQSKSIMIATILQGKALPLLRERVRKFGLGLILASQQAEDFRPVASLIPPTKIVFQVGDERSTISRQLHRKIKNARSFREIYPTDHQAATRLGVHRYRERRQGRPDREFPG